MRTCPSVMSANGARQRLGQVAMCRKTCGPAQHVPQEMQGTRTSALVDTQTWVARPPFPILRHSIPSIAQHLRTDYGQVRYLRETERQKCAQAQFLFALVQEADSGTA